MGNVSRETFGTFLKWKSLLTHWNKKINLVSQATLDAFWTRHALDSWQLIEYLPEGTNRVLDLGSGAGFPGLALAVFLKEQPAARVTLVESNAKKANFLRTVIRELELPAQVLAVRAESLVGLEASGATPEIITARAFAPLPKLLAYAQPFWGAETIGVFPKGACWREEIKAARQKHSFGLEAYPSLTDSHARILQIKNLNPVRCKKTSLFANI